MVQIYQGNAVNTAGLIVPDAIVQIYAPGAKPIQGVATNVEGIVGGATWGPTNTATPIGSNDQQSGTFGPIQNIASDLGTAVWIAFAQGAQNIIAVRCTDGSDAAATATIQDTGSTNALTVTGKYTGTLGNSINFTLSTGSALSSTRAVVAAPGLPTETYDNITGGIVSNTVVAGTNYTSVPAIAFSAPQLANGVQATGGVTLQVYGTPTVGAGGTGYVANDFITLSNGVVVKVATVSGGAVATLSIISTSGCNPGSVVSGSVPTSPLAQTATTGVGINATINVTWGLGVVTMTQAGVGYTSATCTATGGGGSSGTITPVVTIWKNLANAINNGITGIRGPSNIVIASALSGTMGATSATTVLAGGADGTANITSSTLIGVDVIPRKGMYALRGQGTATFTLADLSDVTKFGAMLTFGNSEGTYGFASTPSGDTVSNVASEMTTAGVDGYNLTVMFGDWVTWFDQVNQVNRTIAPATFAAGLRAATVPQNSTLNLPVQQTVGTQKSAAGGIWTTADRQTIINDRVDMFAQPVPGGNYLGVVNGRNCSSNGGTNGDNYTMMTNFLAKSIGAWAGSNIGLLQTPKQQRQAKLSLDNFMASLAGSNPPVIGNAAGTQPWQVFLNANNNPPNSVAQGIQVAAVKVTYLSVIRWMVVNLIGGQTVTVAVQSQAPSFGT